MSNLLELAERCEKSAKSDRRLDSEIFDRLGLTPTQERHCKDWCGQNGRTDLTRSMYIEAWAPHVTGSIDAAMGLVPDGFFVSGVGFKDKLSYGVQSHFIDRDEKKKLERRGVKFIWTGHRPGTSSALSLCAAALRARHALEALPASDKPGVEGE